MVLPYSVTWGWLIVLAPVCVFGFFMFIFPLITQRKVNGYENKLIAQDRVDATQVMLQDQVIKRFGRGIVGLVLAAMVLLFFAGGLGYKSAKDQDDFFVLEDAPGYVVAAMDDEMMILAAYDPISLTLKKKYSVRRFTSDHAAQLEKKHIGKLKRPLEEERPAH